MGYDTLFDIWKSSASKFPNKIALTNGDNTDSVSFLSAYREICYLAEVFKDFHIERHDKVCIFAENFPHWLLIEQAAICLGAISVAKNSQNSIAELDYVFHNSDSIALITDKVDIINYFMQQDSSLFDRLKMVIYLGKDKIFRENNKIKYFEDILKNFDSEKEYFSEFNNKPDDICYIHYTSGTSSSPKGSILVNYGMAYQVEELQKYLKDFNPKSFIATFPLASAGGKAFNLYAISMGCKITYEPYKKFFELVDSTRPDFLHCAPKIMITMYGKYKDFIKSQGKLFETWFNLNYYIATQLIKLQRLFYSKRSTNIQPKGINAFFEKILSIVRKIQHKIIFKKVKNFLLDDNITIGVGSASLAKEAEDFYNIIGVDIVQHYGMTETTGLTTHTTIQDQKERPYTVGVFFSKTKFKIIDPETKEELKANQTGLLLIKGPEVMKGYYNKPEETKKALTDDGWLVTGDLAYYTEDKYIVILSRYDDVIVMMNGYNVYAPLLQDQANSSTYVNQMVVVGQGKPYLAGLVVPNLDEYKTWCQKNNLKQYENINNDNNFKEFLIKELNELISHKECHHYFEKLKYIHFLKEDFSVENGTLTNTLKIKYRKICNMYKEEIENLYK